MFPLRKLDELSPRTRLRKIARILHATEISVTQGQGYDLEYIGDLVVKLQAAAAACGLTSIEPAASLLAEAASGKPDPAALIRGVNSLRNDLLAALGAEPSEWDLLSPRTGGLARSESSIFPIGVYLEDIRSPFNVGSMFRTAEAFGAERMLLSPRTPRPDHPRARKTARGAETALPWEVCALSDLEGKPGVFALELGGTDIRGFEFPAAGIALIGSEELGLSPEALQLADAGFGRVSIPLAGAKRSLNVSVAFGILMEAWNAALRGPRR
jgi:TrmH family RNA methyltransferase